MTGSFKLAWQTGQTAAFAVVSLSGRWEEKPEWRIEIPAGVSRYWAIGVEFGFQVFCEAVLAGEGSRRRGLIIQVEDVVTQTVDTTAKAVAYATFRALCDATGLDGRGSFTFDEQSGRFVLARGT
jgi:hypothetical protein